MDRKLWLLIVLIGFVVCAWLRDPETAAGSVDTVFDAAAGLRSIVVHRIAMPLDPARVGDFPGG
jgi:hypothetical protein